MTCGAGVLKLNKNLQRKFLTTEMDFDDVLVVIQSMEIINSKIRENE